MRKLIYLFAFLMIFFSSCEKEESTPEDDTGNPIGNERPLTGEATIIGIVYDQDGLEMPGVNVTCGAVTFTTNEKGRFQLDNAPEGEDIIVDFQLDGYMRTQKTLESVKDGERLVIATMYPVGKVTKVSGEDGGMAEHAGMRVEFPANAFVTSDGEPFNGEAEVEITFVPTSTDRFAEIFPGDFEGLREDGTMTFVESYGFADINITAEGKELRLADNKKATLSYPINSKQKTDAPSTIPLWYYDYDQGQWIEEGSATMQGGMYVGEVSHFTPWNVDKPIDMTKIEGRVINGEGLPVRNATVQAVYNVSRGWSGTAFTDNNGNYSLNAPSNNKCIISAKYCNLSSNILAINSGNTGEVSSIDDLIINGKMNIEIADGIIEHNNDDNAYECFFIDKDNGWVIEVNDFTTVVSSTKDGGNTWTKTILNTIYDYTDILPIVEISMKNKLEGLLSINELLFQTIDGGVSWSVMDWPRPPQQTILDIRYTKPSKIEIHTTQYYLISEDGGKTYTTHDMFDEYVRPGIFSFMIEYNPEGKVQILTTTSTSWFPLKFNVTTWSDYGDYFFTFAGSGLEFSMFDISVSKSDSVYHHRNLRSKRYRQIQILDNNEIVFSRATGVYISDHGWSSLKKISSQSYRDFVYGPSLKVDSERNLWLGYHEGHIEKRTLEGDLLDEYYEISPYRVRRIFPFGSSVYIYTDRGNVYRLGEKHIKDDWL